MGHEEREPLRPYIYISGKLYFLHVYQFEIGRFAFQVGKFELSAPSLPPFKYCVTRKSDMLNVATRRSYCDRFSNRCVVTAMKRMNI